MISRNLALILKLLLKIRLLLNIKIIITEKSTDIKLI